ncbi:MAG: thioredoxin domain-containing protein [bacterium]|nr:thioredoxin domain-containing protein [bacterium]
MATLTLDAMARGGIHDHIGGGFHRYATDPIWLLPHFEKMLYDNAQLARIYVKAYELTGKERYKRVAGDIYNWVLREMTDPGGGFYSALDADSSGEEGLFYVWRRKEIIEILGEKSGDEFCKAYGFVEGGNFVDQASGKKPGTNIPHLPADIKTIAKKLNTDPAALLKRLESARGKLLKQRVKRVWPHKDDKVLTSWNGLMIEALAIGGRVLKDPRLTAAAEKAATFILRDMQKNGRLLRTWRRGSAKLNAYLNDYAFLGLGLVELHRTTGDKKWLAQAVSITDVMIKNYSDPDAGGFFFTSRDHEQLLARTKDPFDLAVPSGNAVAVRLLVELGHLTGQAKYRTTAKKALDAFAPFMQRSPRGMSTLLHAAGRYLATAPK